MKKLLLLLLLICFQATAQNQRVLLNAEAFGFGPSAAIAEIFPYLRDDIDYLGYAGFGHTLDLQRNLPYDAIEDYGSDDPQLRKRKFQEIASHYDLFVTALDFEAAGWAKELGLKVIIYDPLTWYWKEIPAEIKAADLYISQNFFGVEERIMKNSSCFPETIVVPALVPSIKKPLTKNELLVNLGGLSNPYLEKEDLEHFAAIVFSSIKEAISSDFDQTTFLTSKKIAESQDAIIAAKTLKPKEVQTLLSASRLAIMTSGLGNIYEASSMEKPVVFLPPTNDSQGQQVALLKQHAMVDFLIDWSDIFQEETPIDYFASQDQVMRKIAVSLKRFNNDPTAKIKFKELITQATAKALANHPPALAKVAKTFQIDGAKEAANHIINKKFVTLQ